MTLPAKCFHFETIDITTFAYLVALVRLIENSLETKLGVKCIKGRYTRDGPDIHWSKGKITFWLQWSHRGRRKSSGCFTLRWSWFMVPYFNNVLSSTYRLEWMDLLRHLRASNAIAKTKKARQNCGWRKVNSYMPLIGWIWLIPWVYRIIPRMPPTVVSLFYMLTRHYHRTVVDYCDL